MENDNKRLYELALQDLDTDEIAPRNSVAEFVEKNHLGKGFCKKSLDFIYYWYYTTAGSENAASLEEFKQALPKGPFVYFSKDKLSISTEEFRRIEFEYEKEKYRKQSRKKPRSKKKFI